MKLLRELSGNLTSRLLVTLCGALASIVLARAMGASEYGRFAFAYSLIYLALLPAKVGLDGAATRFIAGYIEKNEMPLLKGFLTRSRQIILGTTVAIVFIVYGIYSLHLITISSTLLIAAIPTFLLLAHIHRDQFVLIGFDKSALAPLPEGVIRSIILMVGVGLIWWNNTVPLTAEISFYINSLGVLFAFLIADYTVRKLYKEKSSNDVEPQFLTKYWIKIGTLHLLINCSHIILSQTDILMLGMMESSDSVGYYSVGLQISTLALFFTHAINPIVCPKMAAAHAAGDKDGVIKAARDGTDLIFYFSLPVILGLILFGKPLLALLYGEAYVQTYGVMCILLIGQMGKIISAPIGYVMTMTEREHTASIVIGIAAVINCILNLLLIPVLGVQGAAISTAITSFLWNGVFVIFIWRKYGEFILPRFPSKKLFSRT